MRRKIVGAMTLGLVAAYLPLFANLAAAQEEKKEKPPAVLTTEKQPMVAYRLEYNVREVENGKRVNARSYTTSVDEDGFARIRVGSKVPIPKGHDDVTYNDVGINIDCAHLRERDNYASFHTNFEASSVVSPEQGKMTTGVTNVAPVFRQVSASFFSVVPIGKPVVIGSFDDVSTNRRYEIEVTVTKIK